MDPKKLAAFAGAKGGGAPPGKKEGGPPGKGKPPPGKKDGGDQKDQKKDKDGGGDNKFNDLKGCLKEYADDIEASIDELDHEDLTDPDKEMSPEDQQILKEGLQTLDKKLVGELHKAGEGDMSMDDAHKLASDLEEDGTYQDAGLLAGWLYRASQAAKDMAPDDDSSGKLPEDEDDEEHEDEQESGHEE